MARTTPATTAVTHTGGDYEWCTQAGDAPTQEIIDLAASLKDDWNLIYQYVYNKIDLEPGAESSKGSLGTYLDQSGTSFDQATLLITLLRAAGYQAQYVVGTAMFTPTQLGLSSLPPQLLLDAAGASNGNIPYAWVQVYVDGAWRALDPANKTYTILQGTNLTQWLPTAPPASHSLYTSSNIVNSDLNVVSGVYNAFLSPSSYPNTATGSLTSLIGGRRIVQIFTTQISTRTGGTTYNYLPPQVRTGIAFSSSNVEAVSPIYICTDQIYGHTLAIQGGYTTSLTVDGLALPLQSGFYDPVQIEIWHPSAGGEWSQVVQEAFSNEQGGSPLNAVIALSFGHTSQSRATHDANILDRLGGANQAGTNPALLAVSSTQLSQASQAAIVLDQLAGTYTVNHHTIEVVRSNNSVETPVTTTSSDQITSTPGSGLSVAPQAVSYALSAAQSAQQTIALAQSGASQPISAAGLLSSVGNSGALWFAPANYYAGPIQGVYQQEGFDIFLPLAKPAAGAPYGFVAMNRAGVSQFVLVTPGSTIFSPASDLTTPAELSSAQMAGAPPEAGPSSPGLSIARGDVQFATPLLSIGSTAPYTLEFDLLYSSRADNMAFSNGPDAPGFGHNLEMRATASSDGFSLMGSELAGPALAGISAAWTMLVNANVVANYYASGGSNSSLTAPVDNVYAMSVAANWLIQAGTNNAVTVKRGLTNSTFIQLPWPGGGYVSPSPTGEQLTQVSGAYELRTAQGSNIAFNSSDGQVGSVTTPVGVQTTFTYQPYTYSGSTKPVNLLSKVATGPHALSFGYTAGQLTSVTDETARQAVLGYYANALVSAYKPDNIGGGTPTFHFNYYNCSSGPFNTMVDGVNDASGYHTSIGLDSRCKATFIVDANLNQTNYYNAPGRTEVDDAVGNEVYTNNYPAVYFGDWNVSDVYSNLNINHATNGPDMTRNVESYAGQIVSKILPEAVTSYHYTYDSHGNLASTATAQTANNVQIVNSTTWDQTWNKPHLVIDPLSRTTTYSYNTNGTLASVVEPTVDGTAQTPSPTESFTYWPSGQVETDMVVRSTTSGDTDTTSYGYDKNYNLQTVTVDSGAFPHQNLTTTLTWDAVGNLSSVETPTGHTTTMPRYDPARRLLQTVTPPIIADGGATHTTAYQYFPNGLLKQTSQDADLNSPPTQLVSTYTYDNVGNLLKQTIPSIGSSAHTIVNTYDADERLSTVTTPTSATASVVKTLTYDADSRLFQVFLGASGSGVNNLVESHLYNGDGLPLLDGDALANISASPASPIPHAIIYTYDGYDRLTKTTYGNGTTEVLALDLASRVTLRTDRRGNQVTYTYDNLDRTTGESQPNSTAGEIATNYNLVDQPTSISLVGGSGFTYNYDTAGRQTQTTMSDGKIIQYGYDGDNNTTFVRYPDGYSYNYFFDELDRMSRVSEVAPGASSSANLVTYSYNPLSQATKLVYGNGTSASYAYDAFEGLQTVALSFAPSSATPNLTYSYMRDYAERRLTDTVTAAGSIWHPPTQNTDTYTTSNTSAPGLNQYTTINSQTLTYDNSGNLKTDPTAALGSATYAFDYKNRLTSAINSQNTATYAYDALSRRSLKTVNGSNTVFVDDGSRTIADYNESGAEIQHYVYGAGNTPLLEEVFNGATTYGTAYYLHTDGLGSVVALSNLAGVTTGSFTYSPFGEATVGAATPYHYAGMRLDTETQLYYDNARYYSPKQGRFLSPDPIGVQGGINIYAYAGNDPLNGVDLSGLDGSDPEQILVIGTYLTAGGNPGASPGGSNGKGFGGDGPLARLSNPGLPQTLPSYNTALQFSLPGTVNPDAFGSALASVSQIPFSAIPSNANTGTGGVAGLSITLVAPPAGGAGVPGGGSAAGGAGTASPTAPVGAVAAAPAAAGSGNAASAGSLGDATGAEGFIASGGISPNVTRPYVRPPNATRRGQQAFVQGKFCVDCGTDGPMNADHIDPLVVEYYRTGTIDIENMRSLTAVQPQCPTCSNKQGGALSAFSKRMKSAIR